MRTAGVPYGIDSVDQPWPQGGPGKLLGSPLVAVLGSGTYAEGLFVLHTYMSIVSKCIAAEILAVQRSSEALRPTSWTTLSPTALAERFVELERGDVAAQLGAPGLLSTDLFDWYAHELAAKTELREAARAMLRQLGSLAWAEIATAGRVRIDLLRRLYQSVVPAGLRKALGEFFTPRWLAQQVLGRALELYGQTADSPHPEPRLLDPSCGSGTFLVAWLSHLLDELDRGGRGEDAQALAAVIDRVLGIDINPVSAVMARVNLLLTLGDRARNLPEVSFGVFHADSIVLPSIQTRAQLGAGGDVTVVSTTVAEFEVATWLLAAGRMASLRDALETAIRHDQTDAQFTSLLRGRLEALPSEEEQTVLATAQGILTKLRQLHSRDLNEVWARVMEQAVAPLMLGRVDLVVGNPPWVSWKALPDAWKKRSEPVWRAFGLWSHSGRTGGIPLSDVSRLLVARCLATYVKDGVVALLLPQSVLLADPGGAPFRRSHLRPEHADLAGVGDASVPYRLLAVEDFVPINPFSPDAEQPNRRALPEAARFAKFSGAYSHVAPREPASPHPPRGRLGGYQRTHGRDGAGAGSRRPKRHHEPVGIYGAGTVATPWTTASRPTIRLRSRLRNAWTRRSLYLSH